MERERDHHSEYSEKKPKIEDKIPKVLSADIQEKIDALKASQSSDGLETADETFMAYAVRTGKLDYIKYLMPSLKETLQWRSSAGNYLIHIAARHNQVETFKYLLSLNSSLSTVTNNFHEIPGIMAVLHGNYEILLISKEIIHGIVNADDIVDSMITVINNLKQQATSQIRSKYKKTLIYLLMEKPELLTIRDRFDYSPLTKILYNAQFELLSELLDSYHLDIDWNEIKLDVALPFFKNKSIYFEKLKYVIKFLPFLMTIKHDQGENLLHHFVKNLAEYKAIPSNHDEKKATATPKAATTKKEKKPLYTVCEKLEKIALIIKHFPGFLFELNNEQLTPIQLAINSLNKEFKVGRVNASIAFLEYTSLTKIDFESKGKIFDSVESNIDYGIQHFLPIYWYLLFVPAECPHSMPKELVHLILSYRVELPIEKILLMVLQDSKNQKGRPLLIQKSVKFHYLDRYNLLSPPPAPVEAVNNIQIISAVVADEYKKFYSPSSVSLFVLPDQSPPPSASSEIAKTPSSSHS